MRMLIYDFINACDKLNITPDESHIKYFLDKTERLDLLEKFIKFCFYHWDDRKNEEKIEQLLNSIS